MSRGISRQRNPRKQSGATLVEATTTLVWFVPLVLTVLFVIIEATKAYEISRDLQIGAGLAARALASAGSTTTSQQQADILQNVVVGNTIVDSSQFYAVNWQRTSTPPSVTVCVQHKSTGANQPATFPNPDPLHLGAQFVMKEQATFRLLR